MLHHNPEHAACHHLLGLVYLRKNYLPERTKELEIAVEKVPWQSEWRDSLAKAYEAGGELKKSQTLIAKHG